MRAAGFPGGHAFATKGQIARDQARRALDAGLDPAWATGDDTAAERAVKCARRAACRPPPRWGGQTTGRAQDGSRCVC